MHDVVPAVHLEDDEVAAFDIASRSKRRVGEANARQEARRTTPATGVASATPTQCASSSSRPECSTPRAVVASRRARSGDDRPGAWGSIGGRQPSVTSARPDTGRAQQAKPSAVARYPVPSAITGALGPRLVDTAYETLPASLCVDAGLSVVRRCRPASFRTSGCDDGRHSGPPTRSKACLASCPRRRDRP